VKIICITKHFYPENFRINDFLYQLAKKGHKITVITNKPIYPYNINYNFKSKFYSYHKGVDVFRIPIIFFGNNLFSKILYFFSFIVNVSIISPFFLIGKKFDIIFTFAPSPPTVAIPAIILGKIKKIPNIMWLHDLWPESLCLFGLKKDDLLYKLISNLILKIYKNCSAIFTQSQSLEKYISKLKINEKVFYLPVHAESNYLNIIKKKIINNTFKIYFFGNIGLAQDIPSVLKTIEIMKNIKNIKWIFVGEGSMKEWLKNKIIEKRLQKNVEFKSYIFLDKISQIYSDADALLVSLKNNKCFNLILPAKIQSYLASKTPIFAMGNGEVKLLIKKASCGIYCNASDYKNFARLILKFTRLKYAKRKKIGENGYKYYLENFSIEKIIRNFETSVNTMENSLN
jgi:glycosyltransferase involved in cell wall biosynthesis